MRSEQVYLNQVNNESILLATLMEQPSFLAETMVRDRHFLNTYNRNLFLTMQELHQKGISPSYSTLIQQEASTLERVGGFPHIAKIKAAYLSAESFKHQQDTIIRFHAIEAATKSVESFLTESRDSNNLSLLSNLISQLEPYETATKKAAESFKEKISRRVEEHYNSPEEGIAGIHTGFDNLNGMTNGWQRKKLHVIGARPSVGKTAFVLNAIKRSSSHNVFSTLFSLETSDGDIIDRLIAASSRLNLNKVKQLNRFISTDHTKLDRYSEGVGAVEKLNMDVRDDIFTIPEMRAAVRENIRKYPDMQHVVYIDYLTLITPPDQNSQRRDLEVDGITNALKRLAKEFDCAVVALSQLSRGVEGRADKRPTMADLRDSGGIEQIVDFVSFLYRDDYQEQNSGTSSQVEMLIRKNRDGMTGVIKFDFNRSIQEYSESFA